MRGKIGRLLLALTFAALSTPVMADDCAVLKGALLKSGHTPHTMTGTKTDG